jgi:hypothetical protein
MKISELPEDIKIKAFEYQITAKEKYDKYTDSIKYAFNWWETFEGYDYWEKLHEEKIIINEQKHYDNASGSLYKFCEDKELNSYEFDIIKRVMRCRKKGNFIEDLEKTKFLIDLYIEEHKNIS